MRVLHLISSGGMYGAEAVILNLMQSFAQAPGDVCELAIFQHGEDTTPPLYQAALAAGLEANHLHLLPCKGQLDLGLGARLRTLVQQGRMEVLHAHGYKADIYSRFAWKARGGPARVSTCHTWYDNDLAVRLYAALDRRVLRQFDAVVAVSAEVQQQLLAAGVAASRVSLIRNGVAVQPFLARFEAAEQARLQRALTGQPPRVGLVGRLAPEKGIDVLLEAIALLQPNHPGIVFEVAGEGPERQNLQGLIRTLGLENRVTLQGSRSDMAGFYASLDVLVSASLQEGLPIALLEGMASGLPVVATRVGAVPEVVQEGSTGLLVSPGSAEQLAAALRPMLEDATLRTRLGAAGQHRVTTEFSARRMTDGYRRVYEQALARREVA